MVTVIKIILMLEHIKIKIFFKKEDLNLSSKRIKKK